MPHGSRTRSSWSRSRSPAQPPPRSELLHRFLAGLGHSRAWPSVGETWKPVMDQCHQPAFSPFGTRISVPTTALPLSAVLPWNTTVGPLSDKICDTARMALVHSRLNMTRHNTSNVLATCGKIVATLICFTASPAYAARFALVIGINGYDSPINDLQ